MYSSHTLKLLITDLGLFFLKEGSLVLSVVPALNGLTARYFKILTDLLPLTVAAAEKEKKAISTHNGNLSPVAFSFPPGPGERISVGSGSREG